MWAEPGICAALTSWQCEADYNESFKTGNSSTTVSGVPAPAQSCLADLLIHTLHIKIRAYLLNLFQGRVLKVKMPYSWYSAAKQAFATLKEWLTFASVHPDPTHQFGVEVGTSYFGVDTVLSQILDSKMHPCLFYSFHLSPGEHNYERV